VALLGAGDAAKRIAVMREKRGDTNDPSQMLVMLRKRAFTEAETAEMTDGWTSAIPFIVPARRAPQPYGDLLNGVKTLATYEAESPLLVGPVFDDSPFYFAVERPWGMPPVIAGRLFNWLLAPSLALLALFAVFGKPRGERVAPYAASLLYFGGLGFGFIAIELALLQNLTLLLGHPIFTLSVLLFTLLAAGGAGSAISRSVRPHVACLVVAALGSAEATALPRLVPMLLPLPLSARIFAAIALIAPLGLAMGMPFPRGLQRTGRGSLPAPPFYWGFNGIMSVVGSVTTVFIALTSGFRVAMLVGCACYVLAALVAPSALDARPGETVESDDARSRKTVAVA